MGIFYRNLDKQTREFMLRELELDVKNGSVYISTRLNSEGQAMWVKLLKEAIAMHDDDWLAKQLRIGHYMKPYEKRLRSGRMAKVPVNAPETLAEGEFNRFYVRGLCARAIAEDIKEVEVYRGKQVRNPRPQSESKIGMKINPKKLLEDLRESLGVDPALGIPPGPNSGLTVCLSQK